MANFLEPKHKFRLKPPSIRTFIATMITAAIGFLTSIVYMVLYHHERAFWDMLFFSVFVVIVIFISAYVLDYLDNE